MKKRFIFIAILTFCLMMAACSQSGQNNPQAGKITSGATPTSYSTPWGAAAIIKASLPASIPCVVEYNIYCEWSYSALFESQNGIGGVIERVRRVYVNKNGVRYTYLGGSGWDNYHIIINPTGVANYIASWSQKFDAIPDLRDGKVEITYEGHDDNGNFFRGTIITKLASNE